MTDASQDYRDNMYGMSGVQQFLKRKKKKENDDAVKMECGKEGGEQCGATLGGGESKELPKKKSGPSAEGEKNEVLSKKEAENRAKEFERKRSKAFVPSTKKTFVGPPKPEYLGR